MHQGLKRSELIGRRLWSLGASMSLLSLLWGCKQKRGALTLFAASSLADVLQDLLGRSEVRAKLPNVQLQFAGSGQLVRQIEHGAKTDLLVVADPGYLAPLERAGLIERSQVIAKNSLSLVLRPGVAERIVGLNQLPEVERISIGTTNVPIGRYTQRFLELADAEFGGNYRERTLEKVVSYELNVRQVLSKVLQGEADAAIVYHTDALAHRAELVEVPIPDRLGELAVYSLATMKGASQAKLAATFADELSSPLGRAALSRFGFLPPDHGSLGEVAP